MRISTNTMYDLGVASMQQATSDMVKTQQQLAAGRRILTPSDDPIASARALEVTQSQSLNLQYDTNIDSASSSLSMEDGILGSVTELIIGVRTEAIAAGNPLLTDSSRASIAAGLRGRYQELLGLANSTDGNGQYLFSGYKNATPFAGNLPALPAPHNAADSVTYSGDQGQRLVQISPSRQIAVSDSGVEVFESIKNDDTSTNPSAKQSLFMTIKNLIATLETPGTATLSSGMNAAKSNLDNALSNVLAVRASVGTRLQELDSAKFTGEDLQLQYTQTLSGLQDLDYTKAASDLARQKAALEAAQLSFTKIQGLSLFNFIT